MSPTPSEIESIGSVDDAAPTQPGVVEVPLVVSHVRHFISTRSVYTHAWLSATLSVAAGRKKTYL